MFTIRSHMEFVVERTVNLPIEIAERLIETAARAKGVNDTPTLMMFAEVRKRIEDERRRS
ncbi:hypothetical protein [Novosphingobium sp.]|uniref:hypothetical protein n=1 Tax=Novosphingobium sp. TaxID=1874826 RepID=UPI0028B248A9|nr:hypothetical protein [Novosphingobium sp.]